MTTGHKDGFLVHRQMTIKIGCLLHYSGIAGNKTGLWDGKQLHWGRRIMRPSLYPLNLTHSPLPGRVARSLEWHYLRWRSHAQPYTEHSGWGGVMWKAASAGPSERIEAPCLKLPSPAVSHALWYLWRTRGEKKKMLLPTPSIPYHSWQVVLGSLLKRCGQSLLLL